MSQDAHDHDHDDPDDHDDHDIDIDSDKSLIYCDRSYLAIKAFW